MDMNEKKRLEEERLRKVQEIQKKYDKTRRRNYMLMKVLIVVFSVIFACFVFFAGQSAFIQYSWNKNTEKNNGAISFVSCIPGGQWVIEQNMRYYLNEVLKKYNDGKMDEDELSRKYERVELYAVTEQQQTIMKRFHSIKEKLTDSKRCFELGKKYEEQGEYIFSMSSYQKVVEQDSNYNEAISRIMDMKELYRQAVFKSAYLFVASDNLKEARVLFEEAGSFFPNDQEIKACRESGEVSGNPLYYLMAETVCEELNIVEKDENHTEAECEQLVIYSISDSAVVVGAGFHLESPPGCYFYYTVGGDGSFDSITAEEFADKIRKDKNVEQIMIDWKEDLEKDEKLNVLFENLIQLGPSYEGENEKSIVSVSEIKENDDAMWERIEKNDEGGMNLAVVVLGELLCLFVVFWMIFYGIKKIK